jgi:hypothetical protein
MRIHQIPVSSELDLWPSLFSHVVDKIKAICLIQGAYAGSLQVTDSAIGGTQVEDHITIEPNQR